MFIRHEIDYGIDGLEDTVNIKLVFSGCARAQAGNPCEQCHNSFLWSFDGPPFEQSFSDLENALKQWKRMEIFFNAMILLGGEPLDQDITEVKQIIEKVREFFPTLPVMLYTGYDKDTFLEWPLRNEVTWVKTGWYDRTCPNERPGSKLASGNQFMWHVTGSPLKPELKEIDF